VHSSLLELQAEPADLGAMDSNVFAPIKRKGEILLRRSPKKSSPLDFIVRLLAWSRMKEVG